MLRTRNTNTILITIMIVIRVVSAKAHFGQTYFGHNKLWPPISIWPIWANFGKLFKPALAWPIWEIAFPSATVFDLVVSLWVSSRGILVVFLCARLEFSGPTPKPFHDSPGAQTCGPAEGGEQPTPTHQPEKHKQKGLPD